MKTRWFALVSCLMGSVSLAQAAGSPAKAYLMDLAKGSGAVEFRAIGRPSALKILGKGAAPTGSFEIAGTNVKGDATFDLNTLDTGIKLRNQHMKEKYLETEKFPQAKLKITKIELPSSFSGENAVAEKLPFVGTLSLHGVEKPISGEARVQKTGAQVALTAGFGLKISDYGIASPGFAGITMAEDVQISVQTTAPLIQK